MSLYPKFRDVHLWVGLIVMLPIVAIAATGVMLNHEHALGLKFHEHEKKQGMRKENEKEHGEKKERERNSASDEKQQKHDEKPSRMAKAEEPHRRSKQVDGTFACKPGLLLPHQENIDVALASAMKGWGKEMPLEKIELKNEPGMGMVVKIKSAKGSYAVPDEFIYQVASGRLYEKTEEGNWIKDLHTGKLFHDYWGFMFSDTAGIALVALSLTGVVLYAIPLMKKRAKKKKAPAAQKVPAPRPSPAALAQMGGSPLPAKPQSTDAQQ